MHTTLYAESSLDHSNHAHQPLRERRNSGAESRAAEPSRWRWRVSGGGAGAGAAGTADAADAVGSVDVAEAAATAGAAGAADI